MTAYIIRRLLYMIPIVIGVLLVTFVLFTLVGGDISQQIAGKNADAETIAEVRHEYGFDKPLFIGFEPLEGDAWTEPAVPNVLADYIRQTAGGEAVIVTDYQKVLAREELRQDWLAGLFKERLTDGQLGRAWAMLNFDSQFLAQFTRAFTFQFGRALDRERISEKILRGVGPSLALTIPMFIGTLIISISFS